MKLKTSLLISYLVGACDALTGLLLMFSPLLTLRLMGIKTIPLEPVYLQYIGAFVFGVGAVYFMPALSSQNKEKVQSVLTLWKITALMRLSVGSFVAFQLFQKGLDPAWISVPLTDLSLAAFQIFIVKKGIGVDESQ